MIYLITLWLSLALSRFTLDTQGRCICSNGNIGSKFLLAAFPFWFITVFRYNVGTDYMQYLYGYYYQGVGESREKEIVFQSLIDFSHYINFPFFMITLFGTMTCCLSFYWMYKCSVDVRRSIMLFFLSGFFILSLTMMRQSASTALFFWALCFLKKKWYLLYFLFAYTCYLLHSTGGVYIVVGLVFIILDKVRFLFNLLKPKILILLAAVLYLLGTFLRGQLMALTEAAGIYSGYFGSDQDVQNTSGTFLLFGITPFVSYWFAHLDVAKRGKVMTEHRMDYIIYSVMCWLSLVFGVLRPLIPNGERIIFLFEPIAILSIPFFVRYTSQKYKKVSLYLSYCLFGISVFWYYYYKQSLDMFPYHFIFNPTFNIW